MPPKPLEPGDPVRLGRFELLGRLGSDPDLLAARPAEHGPSLRRRAE